MLKQKKLKVLTTAQCKKVAAAGIINGKVKGSGFTVEVDTIRNKTP